MRRQLSLAFGILAAGFVLGTPAFADLGDRIDRRLDRRGERIERRFDAASDRAAASGHPIAARHLERRGERIERRLDRRGDRIDRRLDRRGL
jgi:hypothetical protein